MKGLPVSVYKNPLGDCTNNGLSSKESSLVLVSKEEVLGPFETDEKDFLVLQSRGNYLFAVPNSLLNGGKHYMFGGNFVYTSDSRFPNKYPLPVHDRVE